MSCIDGQQTYQEVVLLKVLMNKFKQVMNSKHVSVPVQDGDKCHMDAPVQNGDKCHMDAPVQDSGK